MMQFVIAAPRSGSGKTTVTCALLAALKKRGMDPCAFKSGPDYIDPMFHRSVLGVESHNLDLYLSAKNTVRELYAHYAAGHGAVVCEGAMGFYDGQGLTTRASAWELADALDLPVVTAVSAVSVEGAVATCDRMLETQLQTVQVDLPAVISVVPDIALPRIPGMKDILAAGKKPSSVNAASDVAAAVVDVVETKAPQQAERKMEMLDASVDGDLEKFAAALKAAL